MGIFRKKFQKLSRVFPKVIDVNIFGLNAHKPVRDSKNFLKNYTDETTRHNLGINEHDIDIKNLNRFAWLNDYSFDYKGYEISPIDGCYINGYIFRPIGK